MSRRRDGEGDQALPLIEKPAPKKSTLLTVCPFILGESEAPDPVRHVYVHF
mgnify:CR=1 FL=1